MSHKTKSHIPWWVVRSGGAWALANPAQFLVLAYAARHAPVPVARIAWATAAEMGPATARLAGRVGIIAFESSAVVRAGVSVATFAGAAVAGYAIGAVVGTGIAYAGWGGAGARDAVSLYTGGVTPRQYFSTVGGAFDRKGIRFSPLPPMP